MTRVPRIPGTPSGRTLYVLPNIPDDAPEDVKNGLAIRNATNVAGVCPSCGATGEIHRDTDHDGVWHIVFEHESECRAFTDGTAA